MNTIFFIFLSALALGANCVVVQLKEGRINGVTDRTKEGRSFHKFLGIPYAKPPVGKLRFQPPEPIEQWSGTKDVTQPPPICVQYGLLAPGSEPGQEDCLYLNVYVPKALLNSTAAKAPVIVGIHGGAFQTGSANSYPADYFMERNVIFVSMSYRLGLLGFLAVNQLPFIMLDNNRISGNFGLKDQSLALRWVHENIDKFGGDPANVTIMGESAGAASVHFHMFSPLSKGLFQKAIMESGNAFSPWSHFPSRFKVNGTKYIGGWPAQPILPQMVRLDQLVALAFIKKAGCMEKPNKLTCLQDIPTENFTQPGGLQDFLLYLPTIEFDVKEGQAFLPNEPNATNYQTMVPWLTGMNSGEGALISPVLLRSGAFLSKIVNARPDLLIPLLNLYIVSANQSVIPSITDAVTKMYFQGEKVGLETAQNLTKMITDSSWLVPLMKTVSGGPNVQYLYLYDHRGTFSLADHLNITADLGVCHGDEIPMLFRSEVLEAKRSIQDRRVSDTLLKYWINFAISEDPNRHSIDKLWQPMQTKNEGFEYLHIKSDGVSMEKDLYKARYDLWKSLPIDSL